MLGRLLYVLIVAGVLLAGAFAFDFLASEPGTITLDYGDRLYEVTLFEAALMLVIGIVVLMVVIWVVKIVWATIRFITGDEYAFGGIFVRSRERRGIDALGKGLNALAAGDAKTARKKAEMAERKLNNHALTRLINAQAADLSGERQRAQTYYKALMTEPDTAFVGAKGLLQHAMADGDVERALKLANRANEIKPKDRDTLDVLYTLHSQNYDWGAARKILASQVKAGYLPKPEAATRESALILAQAEDAERLGEHEHARALAIEAAKMDSSNSDAVALAAGHLIETGSKRAATKLLTDGWRAKPAAKLAAAYAEIEPDEAPAQRRRRFESLFALQPGHAETHYLKAELALVDEDWRAARRAIEDLRETEPSARSCAIYAAIARGEGEPDHIVRGWLARALGAPRGDDSDMAITQAAMLPLLIGPQEDAAPSEPEAPKDQAPAEDAVESIDEVDGELETVDTGATAKDSVMPDQEPAEADPARNVDDQKKETKPETV